jgi:hypothetical protein
VVDVRVADMSGELLDYWVCRAEGMSHLGALDALSPWSSDWTLGARLVERLILTGYVFMRGPGEPVVCLNAWFREEGDTVLVCAARAVVHARFGASVARVPDWR